MDRFLYGWFLPITLAFTFALVIYLIFKDNVCVVNGNGMNPNFYSGETIAVRNSNSIEPNDILLVSNPLRNKSKGTQKVTLKRCVALPGDTVQISSKQLIVNGLAQNSDFCQFNRKFMFFSKDEVRSAVKDYGIISGKITNMTQTIPLSDNLFSKIVSDGKIKHVSTEIISKDLSDRRLYPFSTFFRFNRDFYGPIVVPKKGMTIKLNTYNLVLYAFILQRFENSKVEYKDGKCLVNGQVSENYTFKNDYYFMLNDYRDDPSDSRTFGPIPKEMILAKYSGILIGRKQNGEIDLKKSFKISFENI